VGGEQWPGTSRHAQRCVGARGWRAARQGAGGRSSAASAGGIRGTGADAWRAWQVGPMRHGGAWHGARRCAKAARADPAAAAFQGRAHTRTHLLRQPPRPASWCCSSMRRRTAQRGVSTSTHATPTGQLVGRRAARSCCERRTRRRWQQGRQARLAGLQAPPATRHVSTSPATHRMEGPALITSLPLPSRPCSLLKAARNAVLLAPPSSSSSAGSQAGGSSAHARQHCLAGAGIGLCGREGGALLRAWQGTPRRIDCAACAAAWEPACPAPQQRT
jgi:hypothetical protein